VEFANRASSGQLKGKVVPWSSGPTLTNAHLARIDGKWFVAQFDRSTGDLVTAFVPNNSQVSAMLNLLGK
jgi:hypothetical protein